MSYRDEARRALDSSAARSTQNAHFQHIRIRYPALTQFNDFDGLLALLRDASANADTKDAALIALLEEHQRSSSGGAFALIAVAMFPALDHIYRSRVRRAIDHDDLWGRVVEAFAEALDRYPVARRRARVAANIEGDTMAALQRARLRDEKTTTAEARFAAMTSPFVNEIDAIYPDEPDRARIGLGEFVESGREPARPPDDAEMQAAAAALMPLFEAGDINEQDRFLLLGVHLYERTLGELASGIGISREAAKKRHLRAIARLRKLRRPF